MNEARKFLKIIEREPVASRGLISNSTHVRDLRCPSSYRSLTTVLWTFPVMEIWTPVRLLRKPPGVTAN